MEHQSFRYYLPGIVFLVPIYLVVSWITVTHYTDSDIRAFVLIGGITTLPIFALPIGWGIYNIYRVYWLFLTKGGYENKDFEKIIRKDAIPFYSPLTQSILVNFSHIKNIGNWMSIDANQFRKTFNPFTSKKQFKKQIKKNGIELKYTEALSDFILFQDKGFDYARSISSVRYALESSFFAFLLAIPFSIGIWNIWNAILIQLFDKKFIISSYMLILISIILLMTLFKRWKDVDKEYDARLIFTIMLSLKNNYFDLQMIKKNIPNNIVKSIEELSLTKNQYATFDLDNTLLIGDIGEAVFALLIKKKIIKNFGWKDYLDLIEINREYAYFRVIEVMNNLKLKVVEDITKEIIKISDTDIEIEGYKIPIPKPNLIMQSIVTLLKASGIEVNVVTASNRISAEIVCWEYFGIPSDKVFGARVDVNCIKKIRVKSNDVPYGKKKVEVLEKEFVNKPIVTGGDAIWDRFLLSYTKQNGIRLWAGNNSDYRMLKEKYYKNLEFYQILS